MSTIQELITICQENAKIRDFRVTHIQLLKASTDYFRSNLSSTDSLLLVCVKHRSPIITSWCYSNSVRVAYQRAKSMCITYTRRAKVNSCIIVWNPFTDKITEYGFNVDRDILPSSNTNA